MMPRGIVSQITLSLVLVFLVLVPCCWPETVALWVFDSVVGSKMAPDLSGNGFDMILGSAGEIQGGGKYGNYLQNVTGVFAPFGEIASATNPGGTTHYLSTLENTFCSGDFTIEGWWRQDSPGSVLADWSHLFFFGNASQGVTDFIAATSRGGGVWTIQIDSTPGPWQYNGDALPNQYAGPFPDGDWHHIALTFDYETSDTKLWVDGSLKIDIPAILGLNIPDCYPSAGNTQFYLLQSGAFPGQGFRGGVDEVRVSNAIVYDATFTPPDSFSPGPPPPSPTPTEGELPTPTPTPMPGGETIALWLFDENPGSSTVEDKSGHGFDLQIGSAGVLQTDGKYGNYLQNTVGLLAPEGQVAKAINPGGPTHTGSLLEQVLCGEDFTVEGWWKQSSEGSGVLGDWAHLFFFGNATDGVLDFTALTYRGPEGGRWTIQIDNLPGPWQYNSDIYTGPFADGAWHHIALTFESATSNTRMWVDGQLAIDLPNLLQGNTRNCYPAEGNTQFYLLTSGWRGGDDQGFDGGVDEMRISRGLRYTGPFTPPTSFAGGEPEPTPTPTPTPPPAETVALWLFDEEPGATTVDDKSGNGFDLQIGSAGALQTEGKYGNYLLNTVGLLAPEGQVAKAVNPSGPTQTGSLLEQAFCNESFTIEGWWKQSSEGSGVLGDWAHLFFFGNASDGVIDWIAMTNRGGGIWALQIDSTPGAWQYNGNPPDPYQGPFPDGLWHHIALTFDEATSDTRLWVDGQLAIDLPNLLQGNVRNCYPSEGNTQLYLLTSGWRAGDDQGFNGGVDEVRISKGVRYTAPFTPPGSFVETEVRDWRQY